MLILEKMLILKTLPFFKYTPDDILLLVAEIAKKTTVKAQEFIIRQDDLGEEMYIIVKGKVSVSNQKGILAQLSDRDIFGELGALTLEKRTASVIAIEETLLLKISHDVLYRLMEFHSGLAKGIIYFLCDRNRAQNEAQESTSLKKK